MQRTNATTAGSVSAELAEGARSNISTFTSAPAAAAP
jgi:hypothetical protein